MKIGDLIRHKQTKIIGLITKELGPMKEKPYFYYDVAICVEETLENMRAPLNSLLRFWEVISEA
jgi:rRNA processing protein Gar1